MKKQWNARRSPTRFGVAVVLVVAVVVSLTLGACSGGNDKGTATPRTTSAASREAAAMERFLVSTLPTGFQRRPDNLADTGPTDLAKAVRDDGDPGARDFLEPAGFVAGYQRLWTDANNDEILVRLYKFRAAAGAASYRDHVVGLLPDAQPFTVTGIPGAKGDKLSDASGSTSDISFTKGQYFVLVKHNTAAPQARTDLVTEVATAQWQSTPGA